nr:hypothetical protein [uncultured Cetobacterium sp.]
MRMIMLENGIEVTLYFTKNLKKEKVKYIVATEEEAYNIARLLLA